MSGGPDDPATAGRSPGKTDGAGGGKLREAAVLALSALAVVVGAGLARHGPGQAQPAAPAGKQGAPVPPPLPGGAPARGADEPAAEAPADTGCRFTDRGFGDYLQWRPLPLGKALIPPDRGVAPDGSFRLLVHFHGGEPVRKELAPEGLDLVIAAVDAGTGTGAYLRAFEDEGAFPRLVASVEREVAAAHGLAAAEARPIFVSSWSAGSGAVSRIVARPHERVQGLILLDSLYASYPGTGKRALQHGQLAPFVDAARAAREGGPLFFLSHTEIATPDYASSEEVASFLLWELGAQAAFVTPAPADPAPLQRAFEDGHLTVRGYAGADAEAHCAQLRLLPAVLRDFVLRPR